MHIIYIYIFNTQSPIPVILARSSTLKHQTFALAYTSYYTLIMFVPSGFIRFVHTYITYMFVYKPCDMCVCVCAFDSRLVGIYFRLNNGAIVSRPSPLLGVPQDTPLKRHTYPPTPAAIR